MNDRRLGIDIRVSGAGTAARQINGVGVALDRAAQAHERAFPAGKPLTVAGPHQRLRKAQRAVEDARRRGDEAAEKDAALALARARADVKAYEDSQKRWNRFLRKVRRARRVYDDLSPYIPQDTKDQATGAAVGLFVKVAEVFEKLNRKIEGKSGILWSIPKKLVGGLAGILGRVAGAAAGAWTERMAGRQGASPLAAAAAELAKALEELHPLFPLLTDRTKELIDAFGLACDRLRGPMPDEEIARGYRDISGHSAREAEGLVDRAVKSGRTREDAVAAMTAAAVERNQQLRQELQDTITQVLGRAEGASPRDAGPAGAAPQSRVAGLWERVKNRARAFWGDEAGEVRIPGKYAQYGERLGAGVANLGRRVRQVPGMLGGAGSGILGGIGRGAPSALGKAAGVSRVLAVLSRGVAAIPGVGQIGAAVLVAGLAVYKGIKAVVTGFKEFREALDEAAKAGAGFGNARLLSGGTTGQTAFLRAIGVSPDQIPGLAAGFRERLGSDPEAMRAAYQVGMGPVNPRAVGPANEAEILMDALERLRGITDQEEQLARARALGLDALLPLLKVSERVFQIQKRQAALQRSLHDEQFEGAARDIEATKGAIDAAKELQKGAGKGPAMESYARGLGAVAAAEQRRAAMLGRHKDGAALLGRLAEGMLRLKAATIDLGTAIGDLKGKILDAIIPDSLVPGKGRKGKDPLAEAMRQNTDAVRQNTQAMQAGTYGGGERASRARPAGWTGYFAQRYLSSTALRAGAFRL